MSAGKSLGFCLSHDSGELFIGSQQPGGLASISVYIFLFILACLITLSPGGRGVYVCARAKPLQLCPTL